MREINKFIKDLYFILFTFIITKKYYHLRTYPVNKKPLDAFIRTSG